jgi:hypothetical protein
VAAPEVQLGGSGKAKVRDVGLVVLFFALTLGFLVYPQVWYYRINRELRDYGEAKGDDELAGSQPGMSVLAITLGALLIVPPFVSWYRCTQRIKRAQELAGVEERLNGWILVACYVGMIILTVPGLAIPAIVQDHLNKVWKTQPDAAAGPGAVPAVPTESSADKALEGEK